MTADALDRQPPHNLEAEQSVLGACLIDPNVIPIVRPYLIDKDFYSLENGVIWRAILHLADKRQVPDMVTLPEFLRTADPSGKRNWLEQIGGAVYLTSLMQAVPTAVYAENYAEIVRDCAARRRYIDAGAAIINLGYNEAQPLPELTTAAHHALDKAGAINATEGYGDMAGAVDRAFERIGKDQGKSTHTGIRELDRITRGFRAGQLVIVAARPSVGKSAIAVQAAYYNAAHEGRPVGLISLEMSEEDLMDRLLALSGQINAHEMRDTDIDEYRMEHVSNTLGRLSNLPLYIDEHSNSTLPDVVARARALRAGAGVELLIIDYLQLMYDGDTGNNRVQELTRITRALKQLARELRIPVVILSQLSRAIETRTEHTPMLSDLRDSGSIEQDADVVIFIHRPDFYDDKAPANQAELIVAKQRNGPTGRARVWWLAERTEFRALAQVEAP